VEAREIGRERTLSQGAKSGSQLPGRRRPDFFIVGAPRSGTSSLYNYLIQHPGVFMPELKEPHFFYNRESPGAPVLGAKDLEAYLSLFGDVPEEEQTGEASTSYLWLANAAREIRELQPEAKVMMVLRNPVDRAYSHYWYQVRRGGEKARSFEEALADEPKRIRRGTWHGFYYVDCGRYGEQVSRYLEVFGREAVRVYLLEDLRRDARGVYRDAFGFLGVDPDASVEMERVYNRGGVPRNRLFARLLQGPGAEGDAFGPRAAPHGVAQGIRQQTDPADGPADP
jgi:hypothetical protein